MIRRNMFQGYKTFKRLESSPLIAKYVHILNNPDILFIRLDERFTDHEKLYLEQTCKVKLSLNHNQNGYDIRRH